MANSGHDRARDTVLSEALEWPGGKLDFSGGCVVMGVLNVTPDSFSDGGLYRDLDAAVAHGVRMAEQGAAIIDVGGESTRPGSGAVDAGEEIVRVIGVIERLAAQVRVPISIDTSKYDVAKAAIEAGAAFLNDITALGDPRTAKLAAERGTPVILMHMQGTPKTMQREPRYDDVVKEVLGFLVRRAKEAEDAGVARERIFIDPGIGFGKTLSHNLSLLRNIEQFVATGYRVLVGTSRKRFIGQITGKQVPADRTFGTAGTVALCAAAGVSVVRVHDVREMVDVVKMANAISRSSCVEDGHT